MEAQTKKCPLCAEEIKAEARICRFCGARFEIAMRGYCASCHAIREADENSRCRTCGLEVMDLRVDSRLIEDRIPSSPQPAAAPPLRVPVPGASVPAAAAPSATTGENWNPAGELSTYPAQQPIRNGMSLLQLYFSPNGRIGRLTFFFKGILPVYLVMGGCAAILGSLANSGESSGSSGVFTGIFALMVIFFLWVLVMLMVKRFHDLNRSGWNILLWFIPFIGGIIYLANIFECLLSKSCEPNRFGETAS